ncbi:Uu.00g146140.m01.CDS01 [Anthostomella pinea]|uniref:Uu.00g146140.m01.CDS01 n=1 Tax=Anthostomella pinea TaxID=933095 RepID=A0AAI8YLT4_9PEZI|nr:Uu.00g146140.m01.CDS01 [Anthostomella pinea]
MVSSSEPTTQREPVAIVGMGCRWPGNVRSAPDLWELLKNKRDGYQEFDEPRFSSKGFYHPNSDHRGAMATRGGFLVNEDPRLFDHAFFGMTALEVETMDPSQRKLLEVTYEAFENSGETWESVSGSRTGVFVGNFSLDHLIMQTRDWDYPRSYATTGAGTCIMANRISYMFNLQGPSLAIDTACSSSMYAIHLAVNAIRNGDCDSAIVAGSNWIVDPSLQIALDKLGALSPTSRCHTFDASADGYARGEGFAALYLKRCALAVADGSPIRSLIRGVAVNANGRTGGITRPSAAGQEAVIRKAYSDADLPFEDTTYFECHGTGTPVGDPIEVRAVGNVFASTRSGSLDDRLFIGSIKPNLGHTEGASAIAAIMKVVLSLESGAIPPNVGVETLNPYIDFEKAKVEVVRDFMLWPKDRLRRASINSFGFGGANGHCIIDHVNNVLPHYKKPGIIKPPSPLISNGHTTNEATTGHGSGNPASAQVPVHAPVVDKPRMTKGFKVATRSLVLLPFSAHNEASLNLNIDALFNVIGRKSLADIAYTLGVKRSRLSQRTFRIVDKDSKSIQRPGLTERVFAATTQSSNVGFVFTGQGAQFHGMGSELFEYAVFRGVIEYLDYVLQALPTPPPWNIADVLRGNCDEEFVQTPEVSQPVCTAI